MLWWSWEIAHSVKWVQNPRPMFCFTLFCFLFVCLKAGMMAHTWNPSTEEAQTSRWIPGSFWPASTAYSTSSRPQRPCLKNKMKGTWGAMFRVILIWIQVHPHTHTHPKECCNCGVCGLSFICLFIFPVAVIKCPNKSNSQWGGNWTVNFWLSGDFFF